MTQQNQSRYHRQELLAGIGPDGQARLRASHALVVGCGALGCAVVDILARAGIGRLTIVDRDIVERTNLQRQTLYSERDAANGTPKAIAAQRRVAEINPEVICRGEVDHVGPESVLSYARDTDVILDGLDNLHTRFLLNDVAVSLGKPYFYGGVVATRGMSMPVLRDEACLRCLFPDSSMQTGETCDTAGVLMSAVLAVSAHQSTQAIKWIVGADAAIDRSLWSMDAWTNRTTRVSLTNARDANCPCCAARNFEFLAGMHDDQAAILCGRNAVQIAPRRTGTNATMALDLRRAAVTLSAHGTFIERDGLLVGTFTSVRTNDDSAVELTLFPDGRAIVKGTTDEVFARSVYDRFVSGL